MDEKTSYQWKYSNDYYFSKGPLAFFDSKSSISLSIKKVGKDFEFNEKISEAKGLFEV